MTVAQLKEECRKHNLTCVMDRFAMFCLRWLAPILFIFS